MLSIIEIKNSDSISNFKLRELAERAKNGRSLLYIAKTGTLEVGFLCYDDWSDQGSGFIYEIFVLPEFRNQGVGLALLQYSENLAHRLKCTSVRLEPHAFDGTIDLNWLISWYKKQGYTPMRNDHNKLEKIL
ncbi:GNAT family N-acetyltransferase [Pseudomonas tohonis]|uniref:GNAT family N-acetyltransferase n=1 Tax=Pseudomonas tohonis TaxID=2725477 RepID=UPI0022EFE7CF|nr:GNAT family N-acetyltransferase [Pseudomonas tohonis]